MFKRKAEEHLMSREREIVRMIEVLSDAGLEFAVVGGYAVATYMHRFSVDLDIIIKKKDMSQFEKVLGDNGYILSYSKEISLIYGESFRRFEKAVNTFPVSIDLLINGLVSRTTDSSWSFDFIIKNSERSALDGIYFSAPTKELLVAMKMHSGRFADIRDIVAMIEDCDAKAIKNKALRGNKTKLKAALIGGLKFLQSPDFPDSFKGVFGLKFYKDSSVRKTRELFNDLISSLS